MMYTLLYLSYYVYITGSIITRRFISIFRFFTTKMKLLIRSKSNFTRSTGFCYVTTKCLTCGIECLLTELNCRPLVYKTSALPLS